MEKTYHDMVHSGSLLGSSLDHQYRVVWLLTVFRGRVYEQSKLSWMHHAQLGTLEYFIWFELHYGRTRLGALHNKL